VFFESCHLQYIYIYIMYMVVSRLFRKSNQNNPPDNLSCIQALVRYLCLLLHTCSAYVFFAYAWALFFHTYLLCNPSEWWKLSRSNGLIRTLWFIKNITTLLPSNAHNSGYRTLQKLFVEVGWANFLPHLVRGMTLFIVDLSNVVVNEDLIRQ
jgi:hypothetical protein